MILALVAGATLGSPPALSRDGIIALSADDDNAPLPAEVATAAAVLHGKAGPIVDMDPAYGKKPPTAPKAPPPTAPLNVAGAAIPTAKHQTCTWEGIGQKHGVSPYLLFAIAKTESGLNPKARNRNTNGSEDVGLMQVNSMWHSTLAGFGISPADLLDGCVSLDVGAWILAANMRTMGVNWDAVGAYNAKSPNKRLRYANKVYSNLPAVARQ